MLGKIYKYKYFYLIVSAILLLPVVTFPISTDLSAFIFGGRSIAEGGFLYKDFFDVKPPFIYYLFSLLSFVFSEHLIMYRIAEYLLLLLSFVVINKLLDKLRFEREAKLTFFIFYSIVYVSLNYTNTFQVETLFLLPSLYYMYCTIRQKRDILTSIITGLILGLILELKYSFGIIILGSIYFDYFFNNLKLPKLILYYSTQLLIAILVVFLFLLPTFISGNLIGFSEFNNFMSNYIVDTNLLFGTISAIYDGLINNFLEFISPLFFAFFILSFVTNKKDDSDSYKAYFLSFIFVLLLFISVIIESKYFIYHFARFYPFFIIIVSLTFVKTIKYWQNVNKLTITIIILFSFLFSPALRYLNNVKNTYYYIFNHEKYIDNYQVPERQLLLRADIETANYINNKYPNKKTLVINTSNHYINNIIKSKPINTFAQSAFYLSPKSNIQIKNRFFKDLVKSDVVIIQKNDFSPDILLSFRSSSELFFEDQRYNEYLNNNFKFDTLMYNTFQIYDRVRN